MRIVKRINKSDRKKRMDERRARGPFDYDCTDFADMINSIYSKSFGSSISRSIIKEVRKRPSTKVITIR